MCEVVLVLSHLAQLTSTGVIVQIAADIFEISFKSYSILNILTTVAFFKC